MPHGEAHPACSVISGTALTSGSTGPHGRPTFKALAAHVNLISKRPRLKATHTGFGSRSIEAGMAL